MDSDISDILKSWEYKQNTLTIRKLIGDDGREKIQIRINLGILQMETSDRPDGKSPHFAKSMLDYYNSLIEEFIERDGTAEKFTLTKRDMRELDDELMQYYHRRVCFFALGEYEAARRDAEHNLGLMDIIRDHCQDKGYIDSHEQFRPFVIMERARAIGLININAGNYADAMKHVSDAIDIIEKFHKDRGVGDEELRKNRELTILRQWRSKIHQDWEGGISESEKPEEDIEEDDDHQDI